jgi:hypothetical protein
MASVQASEKECAAVTSAAQMCVSDARDHLWDRGFYLDADTRWHVPHGFKLMPKDYRALRSSPSSPSSIRM